MNILCVSFKSKNKGVSSKSKKDNSMGKKKRDNRTNNDLQKKLQRKLKTEKQELNIGGELRYIGRAKQFLL